MSEQPTEQAAPSELPVMAWAYETMRIINKLTPGIMGKALDPDWFLLRQRLESKDIETMDLRKKVSHLEGIRAKFVLHHIENICAECGHTSTEDGCAHCISKQRDEAIAVLRECEWRGRAHVPLAPICPICLSAFKVHSPGCRLAKVLKEAQ